MNIFNKILHLKSKISSIVIITSLVITIISPVNVFAALLDYTGNSYDFSGTSNALNGGAFTYGDYVYISSGQTSTV